MTPTGAHVAAAAHQGAHGRLWFAAAATGVMLGAALAGAWWAWRRNRLQLRWCPVCSGTAVRALDEQVVSGMHASLSLECGECGTWRRVLTTPAQARGQARALRRDRATIVDEIERIAGEHGPDDIDAFTRALRCKVVGVEDFLALTRRRQRTGGA